MEVKMEECCICRNNFDTDSLLENSIDEHFCKGCFKQHYMAAAQVECDNKTAADYNKFCRGDADVKEKLISAKEMVKIQRSRELRQEAEHSKRPIQCPMHDCNRYVSVFDVSSHFNHEHHEVAILQTLLDTRNPIIFQRKEEMYQGEHQCVAVLDVIEEPKEHPPPDASDAKAKNSVTVVLIIARVCANDDYRNAQHSSANFVSDKFVMWMASNIVVNYSYTIAISNMDGDARIKYYGPMMQIGTEPPSKICKTGQGLVLTELHFSLLTAKGGHPLNINVIVHKDD